MKTILNERNIMKSIKYALATVIILMGSYGYYRFFSSPNSTEPTWLVVLLFVIIEAAILTMTTMNFSTTLKQTKGISIGLFLSILAMWLISGVGIDQTIWGMVETKYHTVKLNEAAVIAEKETETLLINKVEHLELKQVQHKGELLALQVGKINAQKSYDKKARQLKDIIWYNGKRCDLSTDCSARKNIAQNTLNLSKQGLDDYVLSIRSIKENIIINNQNISKAKKAIEMIVSQRVTFEKHSRVTLENKIEEALVHTKIMDLLNLLDLKIETPERAYVMLLSFIIYPIYILFIAFMSSNSPEMKKIREKEYAEKLNIDTELKKTNRGEGLSYKALMIIAEYLRKNIGYLISTRKRKVVINEVEIEVIKEIEVEKIIYKDGREIVKVEIEVPYIIEKEIIVEKIVKVPVVEKEFITVPADINLNEFNKLTRHGSVPEDLVDVLKKINDEMKEQALKGANNDKYRTA